MKMIIPTLVALAVCAGSALAQSTSPAAEPTNAAEAAAKKAEADRKLEEAYQNIVSKLPLAQQDWERVLQSQLGTFYLPLHKRDKVAGRSNAWDFVEDRPGLPRILLIGDSVSRAYTQTVRKELEGVANVHRAPANCGPTASGIKNIETWLGNGKWDVIHFNFGIHDRNTAAADYTARLEQLVERMKKTGAHLMWATTTPIPNTADGKQKASSIVEKNELAAEIMKRHQVAVDDLFNAIKPHLDKLQNPNDVHFNAEGNEFLGKAAATAIKTLIK